MNCTHWRRQLRGTGAPAPPRPPSVYFNFSGDFRAAQTLTFDSSFLIQ